MKAAKRKGEKHEEAEKKAKKGKDEAPNSKDRDAFRAEVETLLEEFIDSQDDMPASKPQDEGSSASQPSRRVTFKRSLATVFESPEKSSPASLSKEEKNLRRKKRGKLKNSWPSWRKKQKS